VRAFKQQHPDAPEIDLPEDGAPIDTLRSWLANGIHKFAVDPRRRRGRHRQARQLLAEDLGSGPAASGRWQALASALHRHTVRAGMSELSAEERRVITLAYLEGRTNAEIAGMLGISVSTVRRRLWKALKHLEAYINRSRTWLSAVLLLGTAYVIERTTKLGRWANIEWTHKLISTVAVGAVTATAIGLTAMIPDSASPGSSSATAMAPTIVGRPIGATQLSPAHVSTLSPVQAASILTPDRSHPAVKPAQPAPATAATSETGSNHPNHGCDGNPTSAAPPVPVGRHPRGSPVSHPTAGGCRV
jgi:RNA polymerase sigma factor (sigma-70 family)